MHRPPLPPEKFLVLIYFRGRVNPRVIVKISNDTVGNRTRDLRLVAQCLNQLRPRVPQIYRVE
jgi:hypothetical protein